MALAVLGQTTGQSSGPWVLERSGTTAGLRGIHAVGGGIAWASGTNGTVLRTEDGGDEWQSCAMPPGAEKLDFRGIWAWDANTAIVMSSGTGDLSRLYRTTDGCSSWKLLFTNPDKDGFWDAMAFLDRNSGYVLGDPTPNRTDSCPQVALQVTLLATFDGGAHWDRQCEGPGELEVAAGTGAFAASNSALTLQEHEGWLGVGGRPGSDVLIGDFYGPVEHGLCDCAPMPPNRIWFTHRARVPITGGTSSSGVFSLAFRDSQRGVAVGGDYTKSNESAGTAAWSADGGQTWTAAATPPHGFRSAVAWDPDAKAWIAVGTNGSDVSYDDGRTWVPLDNGNWNALGLPWVVGPDGRIAKLDPGKLPRSAKK